MEPNPLRNHMNSATRRTELDQKRHDPRPHPHLPHSSPSQPVHIQPLPPSPPPHGPDTSEPKPTPCGPTLGRRGYVSRGLGERLESSPQTGSRGNQNVHGIHTSQRKNLNGECTGFFQDDVYSSIVTPNSHPDHVVRSPRHQSTTTLRRNSGKNNSVWDQRDNAKCEKTILPTPHPSRPHP